MFMRADAASRICTTIIAPSFMTAAMFLILPKIINEVGSQYSRMPPRLCKYLCPLYLDWAELTRKL